MRVGGKGVGKVGVLGVGQQQLWGKLVSFSSNEMQSDHLPLLREQHKVIFTKENSFEFIFFFAIWIS